MSETVEIYLNSKLSKDVFDTLPSQQKEDFIDPNTFFDNLIKEKKMGRPPGSKNKEKKASNVFTEN